MQEKRRHKRFLVEAVDIKSNVVFAKKVSINDVSVYGAAFDIDKKLETGSQYTLNLRGKEKTLTVQGVVVRSSLKHSRPDPGSDKKPVYAVGFKFLDLTDEMIKELVSFVRDYTRKDYSIESLSRLSGARLSMRVVINNPGKDILNFEETYNVKDLSSNGMLVIGRPGIAPGARFPMQIFSSRIEPVEVVGKIVRCFSSEGSSGSFQIGIEFIDMTDDTRARLGALLNTMSKIEEMNRKA